MTKGKATRPRTKKFFYRRAQWDAQGRQTLEQLLLSAHQKMLTAGDRTFPHASGNEIQGARWTHNESGLFMQIAYYTPDEPTSTIGKNKSGASATIGAELAPPGKDYLDGDVFVMVKGNHVVLCPSNVRESLADQYFFSVLSKFKQPAAGSLTLDKVAKSSKIKMIKSEGVKEIRLGASLYDASLMQMEAKSSKVAALKAVVAKQIQQIFAADDELRAIKESENLNINISIKFDGKEGRKRHKDPHFGDAGRERLEKASQKIIKEVEKGEDRDGFVIITNSGSEITSGDVRVFEIFKVAALGKSLDHQDAWAKLLGYYNQLRDNGTLAQ